ncbi:uncharacterized protein LOC107822436 [Nicotiana tabacum]|uniref:Uncharacterized protein LOC107822436 n=2 Tax=Nicotiana TaxID=4085 RepID=A0A1S4CTB6_TOBAC|nr:PREDICTED: uncharacterized protein LOC104231234 [Nicotiana sylvestris]XP_016504472.1 PREDICTED: uncharacterized protein LOC107822436 [Nicotiana tabacum]
MGSTAYTGVYSSLLCKTRASSLMGVSSIPLMEPRIRPEITNSQRHLRVGISPSLRNVSYNMGLKKVPLIITRASSKPSDSNDEALGQNKTPFGYTRKDVILIGVGVTLLGYGLKSGLEFLGFDPLQAGNVVQLVLVLGLTVGWISTYIFRVSNKEMTYAQQLRDYESKVMEKRLESLTEAELQVLLEQVEEEKSRLASGKEVK